MIKASINGCALTALAVALTIPVAFAGGDWNVVAVLVSIMTVCSAAVWAASRGKTSADEQTERQRLADVAAMWITFTVSSAVVTWLAVRLDGGFAGAPELHDPTSALFETASGASTTGLTVLGDPSAADAWLQWWRSVLQWLGALGVIVFAVLVAEPSGDHDTLVDDEWGSAGGEGPRGTIRRVGVILGSLTVVSIVAMAGAGEPAWRAVNHGMTAASTGGFSVTSDSVASSGATVQTILAVTMLVAAVSFGTIWDLGRRAGVPLWRRTQVRWGAVLTLAGVGCALLVSDDAAAGGIVFNSISASTTGGFAAGSAHQTVSAVAAVAMVSMLIGGAAGSTSGGIKVSRVVWLAKAAMRWIPGMTEVEDEEAHIWDDEEVSSGDARVRIVGAAAIAMTWLVVLTIGTVVLAALNPLRPASDSLFEAISATSGVGMSSGLTSQQLDAGSKLTLTLLMVLGRIEITAVIILATQPVHRFRAHHDAM